MQHNLLARIAVGCFLYDKIFLSLFLGKIRKMPNKEPNIMKKMLSLLAVLALMFACDEGATPNDDPTPEPTTPTLSIVGEKVAWFEAEGGSGEIVYAIENPQEGLTLEVSCDFGDSLGENGQLLLPEEEWISVIAVGETITYSVARNNGRSDRRGAIILTYGDQECTYFVTQDAGADVFFTATTIAGSLCTEDYLGVGLHNYSVLLSVNGISEDGRYYSDSDYYLLDLYSDKTTYSKTATIPNGTYKLAAGDKLTVGSLNAEKSGYLDTSSGSVERTALVEGEVVVSDGKIVATLKLEGGKKHIAEYEGSLEIPVYFLPMEGGLSTLTGDHFFSIEDGVFGGYYVGDIMYQGCTTCTVYMYEYLDYMTGEERGDQFAFDLQLPRNSRDISGTYTAGVKAGNFVPGSVVDWGGGYYEYEHSFYNTVGYVDFAPIRKGTVVVEYVEDVVAYDITWQVYLFTIDTVDDKGNAIKGTFRGRGQFMEW